MVNWITWRDISRGAHLLHGARRVPRPAHILRNAGARPQCRGAREWLTETNNEAGQEETWPRGWPTYRATEDPSKVLRRQFVRVTLSFSCLSGRLASPVDPFFYNEQYPRRNYSNDGLFAPLSKLIQRIEIYQTLCINARVFLTWQRTFLFYKNSEKTISYSHSMLWKMSCLLCINSYCTCGVACLQFIIYN